MSSVSDTGMEFSFNRVAAMVRRYWYLLRSSWPRILDLIYWPAVQMLMWGFLQVYISQNTGFFAQAGGVFIGSARVGGIVCRGELGCVAWVCGESGGSDLRQLRHAGR